MNPTHIEHIGIAVRDLDGAIRTYERILGVPCYAVEVVEDQKVRTAFFRIGETKVELLASMSNDGPIARFIERRGEGIHHIALGVRGLPEVLKNAESSGLQLIDAAPRAGAEGLQIAFIHPGSTHGVLLELCEQSEP